jgi:hypothetical protein
MTERDQIALTLFALEVDIVTPLFETFFAAFPEQRAAFHNLDAAAGRMTNETVEAMVGLASDEPWVATTIINFVDLHRNYGSFTPDLYAAFVDMTVDALACATCETWSKAQDDAWRRQAGRLNEMIAQACITA